VAVFPTAVALLKETLVVPLELVVQDDATDPPALVPEALLRTLVGAIDLGVMSQLARLLPARVKRLARLLRAVVAVGLKEIAPAVGEDDGAVAWTERSHSNEPLMLEVAKTAPRVLVAVTPVVEVALGHDPKRGDRCQHAALGAVDLVGALAVAN
jgi:hypothetical protein